MKTNKLATFVLLAVAIFLTVASKTFLSRDILDIHVYDTYYVFGTSQVIFLYTLFALAMGSFYYFTSSLFPVRWLTWVQVITFTASILLIAFFHQWRIPNKRHYSIHYDPPFADWPNDHLIFFCAVAGFLAAIALFLIHMIIGIFQHNRK
ncbi:hypothetical protein LX64_04959 [Chitinophaga skermanii]|uniref:Uncharacterized protein n=1 Tax=Chitinophaga skermanii TaxID=331697 RepID=A0A327Q0R8_9BACT|nr:hypothetical protein [Chitinophaga skermanii]RAI97909.1 hypothetical protein LX64_04959 [Chitinophaga skermanii]